MKNLNNYIVITDIEALGFIFDEYTSKQYSITTPNGDKYSIDFDCLDRTDVIYDGIGIVVYDDMCNICFKGYIRNKSEFILLLKQLNIV
jgi:hypothetical protein